MADQATGSWIYEDGIGERRAALVADGHVRAMRVERDGDGVRAGAVLPARLVSASERLALSSTGEEIWLRQLPAIAEGSSCLIAVTRAAVPERDVMKRAMGRVAGSDAVPTDGPSLLEAIRASGRPVRMLRAHEDDALEAAGWSEALAQAAGGVIPFDGGLLRMSLTPAMTVFDVDGSAPALALATGAAVALAETIERFDIGGSIVADFPTLADKAARVRVAEAFDGAAIGAFERTAVNGYGLLQVIRPRLRASIAERVHYAPVETAALMLLRRAERAHGHGALEMAAHPAVIDWLGARPDLLATLARRTGRSPVLRGDAARPISGGDAQ